ncbi:unnamed protein product [Rotaria magnacalcarata]|uniref:Uncharacterized protein n=5 Tax=Rotaria magnacalcarata TaxID=392030 RepID=A0A816SYT2_9BILA|nr:unnamed protein product [Rotaria magnacalcarata]CAF3852017.1 unnamed protein product [Rotaria magnacalcarata]
MEDFDEDDFFRHRSPDYAKVQNDKQMLTDHCALEHDKLITNKKGLYQEKIELGKVSESLANETNALITELEEHSRKIGQLEEETANMYAEQFQLTTLIGQEQSNLDSHKVQSENYERELRQHVNIKKTLELEEKQLREQLAAMKEKTDENTTTQNNLQVSLKELQDQIERTNRELQEQERLLTQENEQQRQLESKLEELLAEMRQIEEKIKQITAELEQLNEEQRILILQQKDLKKQQDQLNAMIVQLERILQEKEAGIARQQTHIDRIQQKIEQLEKQIETVRQEIQVLTEELQALHEELAKAEARLSQIEHERKQLEAEKRVLEQTYNTLDDQRTDYNNQLNALLEKLRVTDELVTQTQIKVAQLDRLLENQTAQVERLQNEHDGLEIKVTELTDQCNQLNEQKEDALRQRQEAENDLREAQQLLNQLKQQEREAHAQSMRAAGEQRTALAQLNAAENEQRIAEEQVRAAEVRLKQAEHSLLVKLVWKWASMFIRGLGDLEAEEKAAKAALQQARDKLEQKRSACNEARHRHVAASERAKECETLHQNQVSERAEQESVVSTKAATLNQCKSNFEQVNIAHRNANRERARMEGNLKMTVTKLQRAQTQLQSTNNDLQKTKAELVGHEHQKQEYTSNVDTLRLTLARHERAIEEHRVLMRDNQAVLADVIANHQKQIGDVQRWKGRVDQVQRSLGEKVNDEKSRVRELNNQKMILAAEEKNMQQLRDDLANKQTELVSVNRELYTTTERLVHVVGQITDFQNEKNVLDQQLKTTRQELTKTESAHRQVRLNIKNQGSKVESVRQKFTVLHTREQKLNGKIQETDLNLKNKTDQLANTQNTINTLTEQLESTQTQYARSQKILETSSNEYKLLGTRVREQTNKIAQEERSFRETTNRIRRANDRFADNEGVRAETYRRMEQLEKTITELKQYHCDEYVKFEMKGNQLINRDLEEKGILQRIRNPNENVQPKLIEPKKKQPS